MSKKGKPASKPYAGKSAIVAVGKRPATSPQTPDIIPGSTNALLDLRLRRVDFTGTLVTRGTIHIGTGESDFLPKPGSNSEQTEFDLIWRDLNGAPWLPPTTLKGVLRALEEVKDSDHDLLFGAIAPKAIMGSLRFKGACQSIEGSTIGSMQTPGNVSILTRAAIDPGRGTSKRNQLFSKEFIGTGAKFKFFLRLEGRHTQVVFERLQQRTISLLEQLADADGISIGALGKQGEGRIQLDADAKRQRWQTSTRPDTMGAFVLAGNAEPLRLAKTTAKSWLYEIKLQCPVPFLISDPHYDRAAAKGQNAPHLIPLRDAKGAVSSASSILGLLRSRARWLVAIAELRPAGADPVTNVDIDVLFGATGRKGLIRLQIDRKNTTALPIMTQVKLDRFSGAGVEGALVSIQGDRADITLKLDIVGNESGAEALLKLLVHDLKTNGLQLGHSTTRGFGWFEEVKA